MFFIVAWDLAPSVSRGANFSLWLKKRARVRALLGTLSAQKALPRVRDKNKVVAGVARRKEKEQGRQIRDFFTKSKQKRIAFVAKPGRHSCQP